MKSYKEVLVPVIGPCSNAHSRKLSIITTNAGDLILIGAASVVRSIFNKFFFIPVALLDFEERKKNTFFKISSFFETKIKCE